MKEELFQLEIEPKGGDISQQEYDKAKAALDQTLERALKRKAAQGAWSQLWGGRLQRERSL